MALAIRLIVQILIITLPLFGMASSAAPRCQSIFDPNQPTVPAEIDSLIISAQKASPRDLKKPLELDQRILNEVAQAMRARISSLGVMYTAITDSPVNLGQYSYRVMPDNFTEYGRLARDIEFEHNALLVFSAEHYIRGHYRGAVWDKRLTLPGSRPLLFLGLEEIYRNPRVLRSPTLLHELRHLRVGKDLLSLKESVFYGKVEAHVEDSLPGFKIYKSSSYAKAMGFDEIRTFHTTLRANLIRLKRLLKSGHRSQIREEMQDTELFLGMLKEINETSDLAYEALINIVETREYDVAFKGGLGLTTAVFDLVQVENSRFRAEIPLVDADFYGTIPSQKIDSLRGTLYEMKSVTEALARELVEVELILDPVLKHGSSVSNSSLLKLIDLALPHLGMLPH